MTKMHEMCYLCSVTNYLTSDINTCIQLQEMASTTIAHLVFTVFANLLTINTLFNPAKLSEHLFIHLCALPEGYKSLFAIL